MKVTLVGKSSVSGTSRKTGNPYNCTVAHITFKKNGVDGVAADAVWLDAASYPASALKVGSTYDIDRDSRGYPIAFDLV